MCVFQNWSVKRRALFSSESFENQRLRESFRTGKRLLLSEDGDFWTQGDVPEDMEKDTTGTQKDANTAPGGALGKRR